MTWRLGRSCDPTIAWPLRAACRLACLFFEESQQPTCPHVLHSGSRRTVVRWSDGTVGETLRSWDEVLFCEGDLLGKTVAQLRTLHFRRDREYLRSDPA